MIENQTRDNTQNKQEVFADYARYYDLLYRDKDYKAEAEYVARLIRKFHPATQNILELGSGTGIHARLLSKKVILSTAWSAARKCWLAPCP